MCIRDRPREGDKPVVNEVDSEVYAGCWVTALVDFFYWDGYGTGISSNLWGCAKIKDGDKLGGKVSRDDKVRAMLGIPKERRKR